mgnify:CR=1 FL=1
MGTVPDAILEPFKLVKLAPDPEKVVEVVTPDITNPLETVGAPFAILFVIRLVRILDILFLVIYSNFVQLFVDSFQSYLLPSSG